MEVEFTHNIHPLSVSLTYFFIGLLAIVIGAYLFWIDYIANTTPDYVPLLLYLLLDIWGIGFLAWGIANLRLRKTGKFPLGDYAVKKLLKKMYKPHGLPNPIMVYLSKDGKEIIFVFGIAFPIPLMPIEVRLKYENIKDAIKEAEILKALMKREDVKGINYERDKNNRLQGVKIIKKDGSEEKLKNVDIERMEEAVFLMGLKPTYMENTKEIYRQITHNRKEESVEEEMERVWKDSMKLNL